MKRLLRGLVWSDPAEQSDAKANHGSVRTDRLLAPTKTEAAVLQHITDTYTATGAAPSHRLVHEHFELAAKPEETVLVEDLLGEPFFSGPAYEQVVELEVEAQAETNLIELLRRVAKVATQGETIKGSILKGADAAVGILFSEAKGKPPKNDGMPASLTAAAPQLIQLYQNRKANPHQTYGILTGYGLIDNSTAGIRKKQLYLHAGFGGHLKSTHIMNMIVNAAVDGGWNPLLFVTEMPREDVMLLMACIHSANPKFNGIGRPLPSFKAILGQLDPVQEKFLRDVMNDLTTNPAHGVIRVVDTGEFTTLGSVQQRTIREHEETEVDIVWIDYLTRMPLDAKYRQTDLTAGRNETIADAKRWAMSFDRGKGVAVASAFQINREGMKRAIDREGKLDLPSLAQYNSAEREADVISYIWYHDEERATSEPKCGLLKSRWGSVPKDPISLFIEPDSRRMFDLSGGTAGIPTVATANPTTASAAITDKDVDI